MLNGMMWATTPREFHKKPFASWNKHTRERKPLVISINDLSFLGTTLAIHNQTTSKYTFMYIITFYTLYLHIDIIRYHIHTFRWKLLMCLKEISLWGSKHQHDMEYIFTFTCSKMCDCNVTQQHLKIKSWVRITLIFPHLHIFINYDSGKLEWTVYVCEYILQTASK